jgi:diguanylate cyclase (GGDEF)-like protein
LPYINLCVVIGAIMKYRNSTRVVKNYGFDGVESATISQRRRALWCALAIGLITIALIPVADSQHFNLPDFLVVYQTAMVTACFIAAYLILALYRAKPAISSLYLCGGCFFAGVVLLVQSLAFPGPFTLSEVLIGGRQTAIWLWCFWHAALPLSIALYAVSEWVRPGYIAQRPERTAGWFAVATVWLLACGIGSVTALHHWMPVLEVDGDIRNMSGGVVPALMAVTVLALFSLWRATGFRTVLQSWLGVVLIALLFDNAITIIGGHRLSIGWYAGHINGLIAASVLLLICMGEINRANRKTAQNIRSLENANALLEAKADQAGLDFLTGLPGRALFAEKVRSLRARNIGNGTIVAVLAIDLDGFKQVNDTLGHDKGDELLMQTADVLRLTLRDTDIAGRFGGDEFVVCLFAPFSVVQSTMINIAGRIVTRIGQLGNGIGCSIGISLCIADRLDLASGLQQADQAMYMAKKHGKNRFVIYGQSYWQSYSKAA